MHAAAIDGGFYTIIVSSVRLIIIITEAPNYANNARARTEHVGLGTRTSKNRIRERIVWNVT